MGPIQFCQVHSMTLLVHKRLNMPLITNTCILVNIVQFQFISSFCFIAEPQCYMFHMLFISIFNNKKEKKKDSTGPEDEDF